MKQRTISAIFFAAVMIGGIYWNQYSFQVLFTIIAAGALWELTGLIFPPESAHRRLRRLTGTILGIAPVCWIDVLLINHAPGATGIPWESQLAWAGIALAATGFMTMLALFWELYMGDRSPAAAAGHYLLGVFYIGLPMLFLFSLAMPAGGYNPNRVFGLLWLIWTNDTFAYLVGSRLGKKKLFERISPKKTWEGTLGGIIGAVLMAWALAGWATDYSPAQWLALALLAGIVGTAGDLVESQFKRAAGVKDSGALIPGHGGLLDRFDSFIFVLPFAWLALLLLGG